MTDKLTSYLCNQCWTNKSGNLSDQLPSRFVGRDSWTICCTRRMMPLKVEGIHQLKRIYKMHSRSLVRATTDCICWGDALIFSKLLPRSHQNDQTPELEISMKLAIDCPHVIRSTCSSEFLFSKTKFLAKHKTCTLIELYRATLSVANHNHAAFRSQKRTTHVICARRIHLYNRDFLGQTVSEFRHSDDKSKTLISHDWPHHASLKAAHYANELRYCMACV